ncbi:MAG TPA: hypothetical protein VHD76_05170 [Bryobacteraceae bacterium]|jgi:hypothetical protein|nr:hypothetical protein [Bryobacteraceae bacterium]
MTYPLAAALALVFLAPLHAADYYVTIAGLGGTPEYEKNFSTWAQEIDKRLHEVEPGARITTLSGAMANRAHVELVLGQIAREAKADDRLAVFLIGHGSFDGEEYKMNVPGPDIRASDFAAWLNRVPSRRQLVVDMTSASGGIVSALERPDRAVISATKSGSEKNLTVFPRYWVDALRDESADTDKNQVISALEAFRYAERRTAQFYESGKRLATEHPEIAGGERGSLLASQFPLVNLSAQGPANPAKAKLLAHKQELESKIDELKLKKATIPEADYRNELAALLLDLARTQAEIDK